MKKEAEKLNPQDVYTVSVEKLELAPGFTEEGFNRKHKALQQMWHPSKAIKDEEDFHCQKFVQYMQYCEIVKIYHCWE